MKNIFSIILFAGCLITVISACKRYTDLKDDNAIGGYSDNINGRLLLYDTLTQRAIDVPLGNKQLTVSLRSSTDSVNYIVSTKTDAEGYFQFKNLKNDQYRIWYREIIDGKLYSGVNYNNESNDKIVIRAGIAMSGQTGVVFHVTDASGNAISGADVCVSQSPTPSNNNTCEGSNFSAKSDTYGKNAKFNLSPGKYYVLSQITINNVVYRDKDTFDITDKVEQRKLTLAPPTSANNGVEFLVTDIAGNPINTAVICMYKSRELFVRDTCEGSNYSTNSNTLGKATISKIEPGKYYIIANVAFTNFQMIARDSIVVDDKVKPMQLKVVKL